MPRTHCAYPTMEASSDSSLTSPNLIPISTVLLSIGHLSPTYWSPIYQSSSYHSFNHSRHEFYTKSSIVRLANRSLIYNSISKRRAIILGATPIARYNEKDSLARISTIRMLFNGVVPASSTRIKEDNEELLDPISLIIFFVAGCYLGLPKVKIA